MVAALDAVRGVVQPSKLRNWNSCCLEGRWGRPPEFVQLVASRRPANATPHAPSSVYRFHVGRDRMFRTVRRKCPKEMSRFKTSRLKTSRIALSALVLALAVSVAMPRPAGAKTITAVMHSDLRIIHPGVTTAYTPRDHGHMVYDPLLPPAP